jgi:hypothetical protein
MEMQGAVRTTFSMCAALILRRHQLVKLGKPDPFASDAARSDVHCLRDVSVPN